MEAWRSSARIRGAVGVPILRNFCLILERRVGGRWAAITRTHGVDVKCTLVGITQGAHSRQTLTLVLFDDLVPGPYRVEEAAAAQAGDPGPTLIRNASARHRQRLHASFFPHTGGVDAFIAHAAVGADIASVIADADRRLEPESMSGAHCRVPTFDDVASGDGAVRHLWHAHGCRRCCGFGDQAKTSDCRPRGGSVHAGRRQRR